MSYLKHYQDRVDEWAQQFKKPYWSPLSQMANLQEEVGELAKEINHRYGDKPKKSIDEKKEIENELGDVLFTLICIANNQEINLDEAFETVMGKYKTRDKDRHEKK